MHGPILSQKTRIEFREYFVGKTLREIRDAFDSGGVLCDLEYQPAVAGERRSLVEQYYHTVDWRDWRSVRKVIAVYRDEIRELQAPSFHTNSDWREKTAARLLHWLATDGFQWIDGELVHAKRGALFHDLTQAAHKFEWSHLSEQLQRIEDAVETDPWLAIGPAKELIETVCKTVLEERGKPVAGTPDIPTLTKTLLKELNLVPEGIKDGARGADIIKSILRSLGTIGNDLGQLRGLYGLATARREKREDCNQDTRSWPSARPVLLSLSYSKLIERARRRVQLGTD
jgi:hypothetical protein